MSSYHEPVLLHDAIIGLNILENGCYVDATFGGGGHASEILNHLESGHLIGFDQDEDARPNIPDDSRFTFVDKNFRHLKRFLKLHGHTGIDGILADLGVSSFQINTPERGFSTRFEGTLDMRMNTSAALSAADVIETYSQKQLQNVLGEYGEVRNARTLTEAIVKERYNRPIQTIEDLKEVVLPLSKGNQNRYLAQVFQALRIEVNDEMNALKEFLEQSLEVLKPGGRLVVISYHSLEDRLVKRFMKTGTFEDDVESDLFGNRPQPFKLITRKPIVANEKELKSNPRSRSAKLRIAEKK